ncbi:GEVED domain-containing protein [Aureisphaera galaxeae]|uniref:fibronectin type III domain-containing protein n=1 Tax=Aureisphaera galaxeae TaxID=1538023 RepID=UPI0023500441|nr:GEVED domain-containing protein [Aureisphaera galaxeae]MDC8004976.1 GEVED domain-containing protein [Aureisphaera galaxeae]
MKKILLLIAFFIGFGAAVQAQENVRTKANYHGKISSVEYVSPMVDRPNDLIPSDNSVKEAKDKRSMVPRIVEGQDPQIEDDYFVRNRHEMEQSVRRAPASLVFDAYNSGSQPTDPSLAVGPNHVMVVFNTGFTIYDKSGNQLLGQTAPNPAIFPSGGCCDLTVTYDNVADRWVLTFLGSGAQIAVSDGPNPLTAGWYVYNISAINDYQKLSMWSDGYYITDNTSSNNKVWALERDAMLTGDPNAQIIGFNLPGIVTSGFFSPQVLNVTNNNLPAPGGATVVYMQDDAWAGVSNDHVKYWTIDVDWNNAGNSSVSAATEIPVTPFIGVFDNGSFSNLTQPGGGVAIDALQATIMNQAQFRKFGTHNSAVFNFVVDTDASGGELAGVRWMEFRQTADNQPWTLYQEGTYTAPDGRHAWNASLAMDGQGNIGMGYTSMSGPTTPSTVRVSSYFTGRLNGDPLGTMTAAEELIANGNSNFSGLRYGDYSKIDVDPNDDSTFWFINEYINGSRGGVVGVFQMQAGPPDNDPPTDPTNLTASNITSTGATLNWTASTDNVGVTQYNISIDGTQVGTSGSTSFNVTGLSPNTTYSASVTAQDAAGNVSGSATTSFTTQAGGVTYCASASTNVNDEFISRVQLNTIDNSSGAQFYSDFTGISTNLSEGQGYTITITPTWTGTIYAEGYAVWIDYNNNGDFDDTGEQVFSKAPSTDTPNSGSFTVPSGTSLTSVRMRVSMKYNAIPTSCETFTWGEVEDYTINLEAGGGGDTQAPTAPTNLTSSNITDTTVDLSWNASTDNVGVTGYEVFESGSSIGTVTGTGATVTGLTANTSYSFTVRAFDAAGNNSGFSNTENVTTTGGGGGPGQIAGYFFETGFEGWSDPGSDCARINNASRAFEGNFSIRLRDNTSTSNTVSPVLDLTGNSQITFEFHVFPNSMEPGEDFFVEFFNGTSYQVIGNYASGTDFTNNVFFTDTITLDSGTYNFNANNRFRFRCDASGNGDRVYFDQVIVSGDNVAPLQQTTPSLIDHGEALKSFTRVSTENIKLYPNPTQSRLNIEILNGAFDEIVIFSSAGQIVHEAEGGIDKFTVDVSQFASGMYFVRFVSNGKAVTKRFIKE